MCVRALRITVLKSAGEFTRHECHDLNAEKIRRVKYFMFTRCGIVACPKFSNVGAAGWVRKFQVWSTGERTRRVARHRAAIERVMDAFDDSNLPLDTAERCFNSPQNLSCPQRIASRVQVNAIRRKVRS
jgi:hypothetical protein